MARRKKADKGSVKVNFKGVESRQTPPEGDYKVKVLELTTGQSANKNDQIEGTFEIASGQYKGVKLYMYFPLQENSLWKLHAFLTALGEEVPEDEMDIDLSDLVDKEFVGVVTHETYNGRKRAKLTDFDSIDNYSGDDDDKKSSKGGKKGAGKGKSKDEPEKVSRSDVEDMDEDELQELLEKHDLEDEVDLDDHKKLPKKVAAVIEALDEADLLEDDEPEEKPKGKKGKNSKDEEEDEKSSKKSKKDKKPKQVDKSDVMEMDEEELQELLEKHDLEDDVDLDDYKKIGKKREAVCEALDDEDLLNDDE